MRTHRIFVNAAVAATAFSLTPALPTLPQENTTRSTTRTESYRSASGLVSRSADPLSVLAAVQPLRHLFWS